MTTMTPTEQASEDELKQHFATLFYDDNYEYMLSKPELFDVGAIEAAVDIIRTEKLKLLAEVRERVVDKPTGNHNADSLLERDVLIYNQATAYLRTELTKLEALAELKFKKEEV